MMKGIPPLLRAMILKRKQTKQVIVVNKAESAIQSLEPSGLLQSKTRGQPLYKLYKCKLIDYSEAFGEIKGIPPRVFMQFPVTNPTEYTTKYALLFNYDMNACEKMP